MLGRIRPEQKLAAVRVLQEQGHVVAMVGDGVNDVQALKQADLGIAMGSGSPSSRAVARVVLLDNAFSSVPRILDEGRRVIANIERVANLFVTKTVYAALLAIVVAISALPYPFFPRHLTIVSTLTIGIPGFFLAFARGAPRAIPGFTRRVLRFTVPAGTAGATATLATYAIARSWPDTTATQARTAAMLAIFSFGIWILGVIARPLNAPKLGLIAAMAASVVIPLAIPLGRRVFGLSLPSPAILALASACVATAVFLLSFWWRLNRRSASLMRRSPDRSGTKGAEMTDGSESTIVVGVDGSEPSIEALRWAARQAEATRAALHVVTAWTFPNEPTAFGIVPDLPLRPDQLAEVESNLNEAIGRIVPAGASIEVTARVVTGRASDGPHRGVTGRGPARGWQPWTWRGCGGAARIGERALRTTCLMPCGGHPRQTSPLTTTAPPRACLSPRPKVVHVLPARSWMRAGRSALLGSSCSVQRYRDGAARTMTTTERGRRSRALGANPGRNLLASARTTGASQGGDEARHSRSRLGPLSRSPDTAFKTWRRGSAYLT